HLGAAEVQIYVVDPAGDLLEHAGTWEVGADDRLRAPAPTETRALRRGEGLPGRAWLERQPLWVRGPGGEATASAAHGALPHAALHPAAALPFVSGDAVLGVLEFWFEVDRPFDPHQLEEIEPALRLLGESLGRLRAEERLSDAADRSLVVVLARVAERPE